MEHCQPSQTYSHLRLHATLALMSLTTLLLEFRQVDHRGGSNHEFGSSPSPSFFPAGGSADADLGLVPSNRGVGEKNRCGTEELPLAVLLWLIFKFSQNHHPT